MVKGHHKKEKHHKGRPKSPQKDPRIAVWKANCKLLKSKDNDERIKALAKCADLDFLQQGGGLPLLIKTLSLHKKTQNDVVTAALRTVTALLTGATPLECGRPAMDFASLLLRSGLGEDADWHGGAMILKNSENKSPAVHEEALRCFAALVDSAAQLSGSEDWHASARASVLTAGDPIKHLVGILQVPQPKTPKSPKNKKRKSPKARRHSTVSDPHSPAAKVLALDCTTGLLRLHDVDRGADDSDTSNVATIMSAGALDWALQLFNMEVAANRALEAVTLSAANMLFQACCWPSCRAALLASPHGGATIISSLHASMEAALDAAVTPAAKPCESTEGEAECDSNDNGNGAAPGDGEAAVEAMSESKGDDGTGSNTDGINEASAQLTCDTLDVSRYEFLCCTARLLMRLHRTTQQTSSDDPVGIDDTARLAWRVIQLAYSVRRDNASGASNSTVLQMQGCACEVLCDSVQTEALRAEIGSDSVSSLLQLLVMHADSESAMAARAAADKALHFLCRNLDESFATAPPGVDFGVLERAIGAGDSVDEMDARLRTLRLAVTLSTDTEFAATLAQQCGTAIVAVLTRLIGKDQTDDLTTLYSIQLLGVLFDFAPEVAAAKSETINDETEGAGEDQNREQSDSSVQQNECGVVSALDVVLGASAFSDTGDTASKQVAVASPSDAPWPESFADSVYGGTKADVEADTDLQPEAASVSIRAAAAVTLTVAARINANFSAQAQELAPGLLKLLERLTHAGANDGGSADLRLAVLQLLLPLCDGDTRRVRLLNIGGWNPPDDRPEDTPAAELEPEPASQVEQEPEQEKPSKKGKKKSKKRKMSAAEQAEEEAMQRAAEVAAEEEARLKAEEEARKAAEEAARPAPWHAVSCEDVSSLDWLLSPLIEVVLDASAPAEHIFTATEIIRQLCVSTEPENEGQQQQADALPADEAVVEEECEKEDGEGSDTKNAAVQYVPRFTAEETCLEMITSVALAKGVLPLLVSLLRPEPIGRQECPDSLRDTVLQLVRRTSGRQCDTGKLLDVVTDYGRFDVRGATALGVVSGASIADIEVARALLDAGASVSKRDSRGASALTLALAHGNRTLVTLLLSYGADADTVDGKGSSALKYAFVKAPKQGSRDWWNDLLVAGADPSVADDDGNFPLHWACAGSSLCTRLCNRDVELALPSVLEDGGLGNNLVDTVTALLDWGADVNVCNKGGQSPLHTALQHSQTDAARLLLQRGAYPNALDMQGRLPLHLATDLDIARELLVAGTKKPLRRCQHRNARRGKSLSEKRDIELCDLFDNGLQQLRLPGSIKERAFRAAELLDVRTDLEAGGETPLHFAARAGAVSVVEWLIGNGAEANAMTAQQANALHCACGSTDATAGKAVVQLLLSAGVDASAAAGGAMGKPIDCAARAGNSAIVETLLGAAGVSAAPEGLLLAAAEGGCSAAVMERLVTAPDVTPTLLQTALQAACSRSECADLAVVEILLGAGANCGTKDDEGRTLLSLAAARDDSKLFMFVAERTEAKDGPFSEDVSAYAESAGVSLGGVVVQSEAEPEADSKFEADADMVHL